MRLENIKSGKSSIVCIVAFVSMVINSTLFASTMVFDFETAAEHEAVAKCETLNCSISITNRYATSGKYALFMDFPAANVCWPSFTLEPKVKDWSEYDRIVFDLVSFNDSEDGLTFRVAGPEGTFNTSSLQNAKKIDFKGYLQWVVPLCWTKRVTSNNITRVHFNTYAPKGFSVVVDRMVLLKKGEDLPMPPGSFFINDVIGLVGDGAEELRRRLKKAEHEVDYERFRASCYGHGVKTQGMLVGKATSMEKILPRDRFDVKPIDDEGVSVRLARNEFESVQLVVAADGRDLKNVRLGVEGDLVGSGGLFASSNIDCHVVGYVKTKSATCKVAYTTPAKDGDGYLRRTRPAPVGWWPDPILGFLDAVDVKGSDVQSFWIRVRCREGQNAGVYNGNLILSAEDLPKVRIPFSVRVNDFSLNAKLPELPVVVSCGAPNTSAIDGTAAAKAEAKAIAKDSHAPCNLYKSRLNEWVDFFADYGITHDHLYKRDFNKQAESAVRRLKKQGRLGLVNLYCWSQPKNGQTLQEWSEKNIPKMRNAYSKAKKLGILDHAHFYGCDEVTKETFNVVSQTVDVIKKEFPDVPISTTAKDPDLGVGSELARMDWFCPLTYYYDSVKAQASRKAGHKVMWYVCCGPHPPHANMFLECQAIEGRMLMGAQSVKYRPDGFLYYQTVIWNSRRCIESGPFTDWNPRSWRNYNGDGSWACAGPGGIPVPTIRLENFRDGLEDYAYAKILESRLTSRADKNDEWGKKARKLLSVPREVVDTLSNFTDDPAVVYRWRNEMADLIEEK